ncbi:MAG TPA: mechanosensitive ion channel family protein [Rhodospirillales bacterium]|nr:mechanosensitive ion channel family protein [Rhodospirillales bacterium]
MNNPIKTLNNFWTLIVDVWQTGLMGIDIGRLVTAVCIFAVFLILRRLFTRFVLSSLKGMARKTSTDIDDRAIDALENPIRFIPLVLGIFFVFEYLDFPGTFDTIGDNLVRSLIAFAIFWALYRLVDPFSQFLNHLEKFFTAAMVEWLVKAIRATFIFIGTATILQIWGIEVGPILAGLGLFGVAVALGAQDLFKNLIAGLLIIAEKRFNKGDWIRVDGTVEGTVESIGFRSTVVRRFDKAPVFVPNARLSDSAVTNFSSMTHRRIYWKIGVEYRTSVDQLRSIRDAIESYVANNDAFANPPDVVRFVRIDSFSDSSIDIMLYCFTRTTNWGEWLEIKEQLAYAIKEIVEGAGSAFAFPSQSLYIEATPDDSPETFLPPEPNKQE